jgi:hypothetical protein
MSLLKSLKFAAQPQDEVRAIVESRTWLIERLEEQKRLLADPAYTRKVIRWSGRGDERKQTESIQKVSPWWQPDQGGTYVLTVRFGRNLIEFEKGKPGIVAPSLDKLPSIIDTVIGAVRGGELDQHLRPRTRQIGALAASPPVKKAS